MQTDFMAQFLLPLWIGLRYNRSADRQQFLSLLSWISLLGMMVGVAALITVLSVMNGFQSEIRERMLELVAHGEMENADGTPMADWRELQQLAARQPGIVATAPMVGGDVMISANRHLRACELLGIDLLAEAGISRLQNRVVAGDLALLAQRRYGIVLGSSLARSLDVVVGDTVHVTLPVATITPFGIRPRMRQFEVVAIFQVGAEMDSILAYIHLPDAQRLYQTKDAVQGIRFITDDLMGGEKISRDLLAGLGSAGSGLRVIPWTERRAHLFRAVKMEKLVVTFMLTMVVLVAAFNLISILSLMVSAKRSEVAVLRMMGMGRSAILAVFLSQGLALALVGIVVGAAMGILVSLNLTWVIRYLEEASGLFLFDPQVYYVSGIPSELQWQDVSYVLFISLFLSMLFSIYPAYRASGIRPVEALQYQ